MAKINLEKIDIKELAGLINEHLNKSGIDVVLVGGACVSIYTKNEYMSYDLDFVTHAKIKEIKLVLNKLGFYQKDTRSFVNEQCEYYIEFVPPPVAVGKNEVILKFNRIKTKLGVIKLFTPTDCVKDRLSAYYHWNDPQSLEQAINVAKKEKVNLRDIERWSIEEGAKDKFEKFKRILRNNSNNKKIL